MKGTVDLHVRVNLVAKHSLPFRSFSLLLSLSLSLSLSHSFILFLIHSSPLNAEHISFMWYMYSAAAGIHGRLPILRTI